MNFIQKISSTHLDILKEIGNIGAGNAATALSMILNKKIEMSVPNVRVVSFNEMIEMAGGAENVVASVYLRIEGDAPSHMFFILPLEQANKYIEQMTGESESFETLPYGELALSALQELGNILAGSYLTSLSNFTGLHLFHSVPATSIDMLGAIISFGFIELSQFSDYVIVIDTALNKTNDENIELVDGHFFLLPDPKSFDIIFQSLGVALDE
ncbi:chemotaxis protein CheC [Niallia endozanthoxylica]|uniref:Chemotaxis protein CheC n=1 Tax=Niallia endozanthoxylica TaxID=2036016 RepID=A0A5J5HXK1_9BACI|nr:chemotaxis protein CheC [Niallia endozanthoxylica]KAA9025854.1 chemotaxis protein CheC [Niallia endozanthoxylica]